MQKLKIISINSNCVYMSYIHDTIPNHDENLFNTINLENKFLFILYCEKSAKHIHRFNEILHYKKYAEERNLNFFLIYYHAIETISYSHRLKKFSDKLNDLYDIKYKNQIICSTNTLDDFLKVCTSLRSAFNDKQYVTYITEIKNAMFHFVCLNGLIKPHRIATVIEIYERGLNKFGNCSLGSLIYEPTNKKAKELIPTKYKDMIPLLIDNQFNTFETFNRFFNYGAMGSLKIISAIVNVVTETNFDYSLCNGYLEDQFTPVITEKSIKPFVWKQIPIFICPKDNLLFLRKLGFDLFDDVIDHTYDSQEDGIKRINMAIDQLEKICQYDLNYWDKFREENKHRFDKNYEIAIELYNGKHIEITRDALIEAIS